MPVSGRCRRACNAGREYLGITLINARGPACESHAVSDTECIAVAMFRFRNETELIKHN